MEKIKKVIKMKISTFENLLLIYSIILGIFMLYYVFYVQDFILKVILMCLIGLYLILINWHEERKCEKDKEGDKNE